MSKRRGLLLYALTVALVALCGRVTGLRAHGIGTPQALNAPAGPYLLSAWTDPSPLRADETHVIMAVIDPDTGEIIVSGIEATVSMTSMADPTVVHTEVAGSDYVNQLFFAAVFNNQVTEGRWLVGISATGERGASDVLTFEVEVRPARGYDWLWIGLGGLGAITLIWMTGAARPERPARAAHRRRRMKK